jgi:hypothetical protein
LAVTTATGQRRVPLVDDAFARNLLTTVNRVYTVLEKPKDHFKLLAGSLDSVTAKGAPVYSAKIVLPGSISTTVEKTSTNLDQGIAQWEWCVRFVNEPWKMADTSPIRNLQRAIDTLLNSFSKKPGVRTWVYNSLDQSWMKECVLELRITFREPYTASRQQIKDSLVSVYLPLLKQKEFTNAVSYQFYGALDIEGFSNEEKVEIIMPVVKQVINHDFYAGYLFVLNRPYYISNFNAALTPEQRERVTKTARGELDAYYASFEKPKQNPVVQQQQKLASEKIPDDPCQKEIYYLKNKPGYYITYNGTTALISGYSCPENSYTICYLDTKGKLVFAKNIPVASIAGAPRSSASPFIICNNCRGQGYFMEYDWYDMNSYTGHYARSNKLRQISCGVCSGSGHIKVR